MRYNIFDSLAECLDDSDKTFWDKLDDHDLHKMFWDVAKAPNASGSGITPMQCIPIGGDSEGHVAILRYFIEEVGIPADYHKKRTSTALHEACKLNRFQVTKYLLSVGASPYWMCDEGMFNAPLIDSIYLDNPIFFNMLLQHIAFTYHIPIKDIINNISIQGIWYYDSRTLEEECQKEKLVKMNEWLQNTLKDNS